MKNILIVLTNIKNYENHNIPTGLWLGELTHFYDEIKKASFGAYFVSPKGGYVPIYPYSMKFMNQVDYHWYQDEQFIKNVLANSLKPSEVNPEDYFAIYYTGGHGVLWDFPRQ